MNIKSRIKKIEGQTKGFSENCECKSTPKVETIYYEDGKPATSPWLAREPPELVHELCPDCGKAINKTTLIIDFVSNDMPTGRREIEVKNEHQKQTEENRINHCA